ncbi:hypothetical protein STEG23_001648 [Scotinomys teguina]
MTVGCSLGLDITIGHSDWHGPSSSMALRYQHGLMYRPRPRISAQPLMITGEMDINTDPSCSMATDPDMALWQQSGLDVTMALGGSIDHSYIEDFDGSMIFTLKCLLRLQESAQTLVIKGVTDINTDPDCSRPTNDWNHIFPHHNGIQMIGVT